MGKNGNNGHKPSYAMVTPWAWNEKRSAAAVLLAEGRTEQETADTLGIERKSLWNWKQIPEFAAEVDRLSLMVDIASRAQRLRIAMRVVRQRTRDGVETDKDILEWLKFAQSETDGTKLDLTKLAAALGDTEAPVADRGQAGETASETVN